MTKTNTVRVLLVDDHTMFRQSLRAMLQGYPNLAVVGDVSNGEEALAAIEKVRPTVIVMDVSMPTMDGVAATRQIKHRYPHLVVLGLSAHVTGYHRIVMKEAGATDTFSKDKSVTELYAAIQTAADSASEVEQGRAAAFHG
ncbi:MAG TPA: response regulator transcription factor [Nitrospira sp.]|nr:response regulator transcription factor [Nitrospira sp.]